MRVDKYLWAIRLYKTRSVAAEALKLGRVVMDDQPIKASRVLRKGEAFEIRYTGYSRRFNVLDLPNSRVPAGLVENFLHEASTKEDVEKREMIQLARKHQRNQGLGRPTKRDRRDLDGWI